jgi:hypothetical protein
LGSNSCVLWFIIKWFIVMAIFLWKKDDLLIITSDVNKKTSHGLFLNYMYLP